MEQSKPLSKRTDSSKGDSVGSILSPSPSRLSPAEFSHQEIVDVRLDVSKLSKISESSRSIVYAGEYKGERAIFKIERAPDARVVAAIEGNASSRMHSRLLSEYQKLKLLVDSPHVVKPIAIAFDKSFRSHVLIEEYGGTCISEYSCRSRKDLPLFMKIAVQLAKGLLDIHTSEIFAGDINPANILFDAEIHQTRYIDFRLASSLPLAAMITSSPAYMSPEQRDVANRQADYRTDFFSLGVCMYEILTGDNPFVEESLNETIWNILHLAPKVLNESVSYVPVSLARVIDKMMAKSPESRYQSGKALLFDLKQIQLNLLNQKFHVNFEPGMCGGSPPQTFLVSQRFAGRETEYDNLILCLNQFDSRSEPSNNEDCLPVYKSSERLTPGARCGSVFIFGGPGCGKSMLTYRLEREIVRRKWIFLGGKFSVDGTKSDYSAIVQAVGSVVRSLFPSTSERDRSHCKKLRTELLSRLGDNAGILISLVPELESVLGKQYVRFPFGATEVSGSEEMRQRLKTALRSFFQCISSYGPPCVLFLDDVHWMDSSSGLFLQYLLGDNEMRNIMFVGCCTEGQAKENASFKSLLQHLEERRKVLCTIRIGALSRDDVDSIVGDTLHLSPSSISELGEQIFGKSHGNPMVVKSLLRTFASRDLIYYDNGRWKWDLNGIREIEFDGKSVVYESVSELDSASVRLLSFIAVCSATREYCTIEAMKGVFGCDARDDCDNFVDVDEIVVGSLRALVLSGLITGNSGGCYFFAHEDIKESLLRNMDDRKRKEAHLKIARFIQMGADDISSRCLMCVMDHFSSCYQIVESRDELDDIAKLSLCAAIESKKVSCFESARRYLRAGIACLGTDEQEMWDNAKTRELCFDLHLLLVETEYFLLNEVAEKIALDLVQKRSRSNIQKAKASRLLVTMYTMNGQYDEAMEIGFDALRSLGVEIPPEETIKEKEEVVQLEVLMYLESDRLRFVRSSYRDMKFAVPPEISLIMNLINALDAPVYFAGSPYHVYVTMEATRLCLVHGADPSSALTLITAAQFLAMNLRFEISLSVAQEAIHLANTLGSKRILCEVYSSYAGWVMFWTHPLRETLPLHLTAFESGMESGTYQHAGYAKILHFMTQLSLGHDLAHVPDLVPDAIRLCIVTNNAVVLDSVRGVNLVLHKLLSCDYSRSQALVFDCSEYTEKQYLTDSEDNPARLLPLAFYFAYKGLVLHIFTEYEESLEALRIADEQCYLEEVAAGMFVLADHCFHYALVLCQALRTEEEGRSLSPEKKEEYTIKIENRIERLKIWSEACPENFLHRHRLVSAEFAHSKGEDFEAMRFYDEALAASRKSGFRLDEALTNEKCAYFWRDLGRHEFAKCCFKRCKELYYEMQLNGKLRQLALSLGSVSEVNDFEKEKTTLTPMNESPIDLFANAEIEDIDDVFSSTDSKVLLARVMELIFQYSGATYGVLLVRNCKYDEFSEESDHEIRMFERLVVRAMFRKDRDGRCEIVEGAVDSPEPDATLYSASIVGEVEFKGAPVVLGDAISSLVYGSEEYFLRNRVHSVLAIPIRHSRSSLGVLYLENNDMTELFSLVLVKVLSCLCRRLLTSLRLAERLELVEAACSKLAKSEQWYRNVSEFSPVGIIVLDCAMNQLYTNEKFLEITQGAKFDSLMKIVHPRFANLVASRLKDYSNNGTPFTEEVQLFLPNQLTKWILLLAAPIESLSGHIIMIFDVSVQKFQRTSIPQPIVAKMLQEPYLSPDHYVQLSRKACIMFADLEGFTRRSEKLLPMDLTRQLGALYTAFDEAITRHELTRLKIIGDCHMVIGGIVESERDSLYVMASLALEMREIAFQYSLAGSRCRLRIGIHSGPVASGIITGTRVVEFDVWGKTVNVAKRLQESASVNQIALLDVTACALDGRVCLSHVQTRSIPDVGKKMSIRSILGERNVLCKIVSSISKGNFGASPSLHSSLSQVSKGPGSPKCDQMDLSSALRMVDLDCMNVNQVLKTSSGKEISLLCMSVMLDNDDAVRWCIYMEANLCFQHGGCSPLCLSVQYSSISVLKLILDAFKERDFTNEEKVRQGYSSLVLACVLGRKEMVKCLLESIVFDIECFQDFDGEYTHSPLIYAMKYGSEEIVRLLSCRFRWDPTKLAGALRFAFDGLPPPGFGCGFPQIPPPNVPDSLKNILMWTVSRSLLNKKESPEIERISDLYIPQCDPFERSDQTKKIDVTLRFVWINPLCPPTVLFLMKERSLMIDCPIRAFATLAEAKLPRAKCDFVITNIMGSHGKGLEPFAFDTYFSKRAASQYLYIFRDHVAPLWEGSLSGGVCSFEGLSPNLGMFYSVHEFEKFPEDCFVWEGIRMWMIPTRDAPNSNYFAIVCNINGNKVIINTDPMLKKLNKKMLNLYLRADVIFANIAACPFDLPILRAQLQCLPEFRSKIYSFSTEADEVPINESGITALVPESNNCFVFDYSKISVSHIPIDPVLRRRMSFGPALVDDKCSLFFVGTSTAFSDNNTNAILTVNGNKLLIDCGGTYFSSSRTIGVDPLNVHAVYVSHLHFDHTGGLVDLIFARRRHPMYQNRKLQLFISDELVGKQRTKTLWENTLKSPLSSLSEDSTFETSLPPTLEDFFDVVTLPNGGSFNWHGVKLEIFKTEHVMDSDQIVPTHGLRMTVGLKQYQTYGKKILFTTDTKDVVDECKYFEPSDLIFHDCSFQHSPVHARIEQLLLLRSELLSRTWFMHCDSQNMSDKFALRNIQGVVHSGQSFDLTLLSTFEVVDGSN